LRPTPGRSTLVSTPTSLSFSGLPIPERWSTSGVLSVPQEMTICLRALIWRVRCSSLGARGFIGQTCTAVAWSPSKMILSILVLHMRYRFSWFLLRLALILRCVLLPLLPHSWVNVGVSRITTAASVPVDPLQPMLRTMARD